MGGVATGSMKPPLAARPAARTSGIGSRPAERERSATGRKAAAVAVLLASSLKQIDRDDEYDDSHERPCSDSAEGSRHQTARPVRSIASASVAPAESTITPHGIRWALDQSSANSPASSRRGRGTGSAPRAWRFRRRRGRGSCLRGRDAGPPAAARGRPHHDPLASPDRTERESRSISAMPPGFPDLPPGTRPGRGSRT